MGSGARDESVIMSHLSALTAVSSERFLACDDPATCDLMIVDESSAMRKVAHRIVSTRPSLRLWVLGSQGTFQDGLCPDQSVLAEHTMRGILESLAAATTLPVPSDGLAQAICQHMAQANSSLVLSLDGTPMVHLHFGQGIAVALTGELRSQEALGRALGEHFSRLQAVPDEGPSAVLPADAVGLPLTPLLWEAALHMDPAEGLVRPLDPGCALQIARWPDFRTIARRPDHFRLCSLLLKRPCTVNEAAAMLDLDVAIVVPVFNAIYLSGNARLLSNAPSLRVPERRAGAGSMLASMWRHVRLRMGG